MATEKQTAYINDLTAGIRSEMARAAAHRDSLNSDIDPEGDEFERRAITAKLAALEWALERAGEHNPSAIISAMQNGAEGLARLAFRWDGADTKAFAAIFRRGL
jgi:hypothetical protein